MHAAADVNTLALFLDGMIHAAHADLGAVGTRLDPDDWALACAVERVRSDLATVHGRLVALADLAHETIDRSRRRTADEGDKP